jgi:GPH family glycoside/pentoside/hexuronide:cation symporter
MGAIMGGIMLATALITFFTVHEPRGKPSDHSGGFLASYVAALRMKVFRLVLLPYVFHMTGVTIIQGGLLYYFTYIYEAQNKFQFALMFLLVSAIVFIPVWVKIAKRIGKKLSYNLGMGWFSLLVLTFAFTAHLGGLSYAYLLLVAAGIGFATHYVMPHALLPDVVEYDYAHNSIRREGVFYSLWTFSSKLGQALAIGINGWVLDLFNYVPNTEQSAEAIFGIRLICGPIPAIFFIGGIIVLSFYPITPDFYARLQEMIRLKEEGEGGSST